jgi:uncharacterized membrane protein YphA (DoxX/SURF4 family)
MSETQILVGIACRILIGAVFVFAVTGKIRTRAAWRDFTSSVGSLHLPGATVIALLVACAEALVVVLMVVPGASRHGFVLAVMLLSAFTSTIAYSVRGGRKVTCNCFGKPSETVGRSYFLRNAVLLVAALLGAFSPLVTSSGSPSQAGFVLAGGLGALAATGLIYLDDLRHLFSATPVK